MSISQQPAPATLAGSQSVAATAVGAAPSPFHWRQLESDDYSTYIANLRAIGCPEDTVRDIVAAEVAADDAAQRQAIISQPALTEYDRNRQQIQLAELTRYQAARVAELLRTPDVAVAAPQRASGTEFTTLRTPVGPSQPLPSQAVAPSVQDRPISASVAGEAAMNDSTIPALLPASLVPVDPSISLTPQQVTAWETLAQDFAQAVNNSPHNPSDPAYRARWVSEREYNDQMFRQKFGTAAFLQQNAAAARTSQPTTGAR